MAGFDADHFHDEKAAYAFVESRIWANGRRCPHCGVIGRSGPLSGQSTRLGTYKCYACRKPFTVKIGTVFEGSHIPLHIWLQAIFLLSSEKQPVSANQLGRVLGVSVKSALYLLERIGDGSGAAFLGLTAGEPPAPAGQQASGLPAVPEPVAVKAPPNDVSDCVRWKHGASRIRLSHAWQGAGQSRRRIAISRAAAPAVRFATPVAIDLAYPAEIGQSSRFKSPVAFAYPPPHMGGPLPDTAQKPEEVNRAIPRASPEPRRPRAGRPKPARGLLHSDMDLPGGIPAAPAPAEIGPAGPRDSGKTAYRAEPEVLPFATAHSGLAVLTPYAEIFTHGLSESSTGQPLPHDVAPEIFTQQSTAREAADAAGASLYFPHPDALVPSPERDDIALDAPAAETTEQRDPVPRANVPEDGPACTADNFAGQPVTAEVEAAVSELPWQPIALDSQATDEMPVVTRGIVASAATPEPALIHPGAIPVPGIEHGVVSCSGQTPAIPERPVWAAALAAIFELDAFALIYLQTPAGADAHGGEALAPDDAPAELRREYAVATCDSDTALGLAVPAPWLSMTEQAAWQRSEADLPTLAQDGPADTSPEPVRMPVAIFAWQPFGTRPAATGVDIAYHANDNRGAVAPGMPPPPPAKFWLRARQRVSLALGGPPVRHIEVPSPEQQDRAVAIAAQATGHEFAGIPLPAQFTASPTVLFRLAELSAAAVLMEGPLVRTAAAILPELPAPTGGVVVRFPERLTEASEDWTASNPVTAWHAEVEFPGSSITAAPEPDTTPIPQPLPLEAFDYRPPAAQDDEYALAPALHGGEILRREIFEEQTPDEQAGAQEEEPPAYLVPPLPFSAEDAAAPSAIGLSAPDPAGFAVLSESAAAAPEPVRGTATEIFTEATVPGALDVAPGAGEPEAATWLTAPLPAGRDSFLPSNAHSLSAVMAAVDPEAAETPLPIPAMVAPPASNEQPAPAGYGVLPLAGGLVDAGVADLPSRPATAELDSSASLAIPPQGAAAGAILPIAELPEIPPVPAGAVAASAAAIVSEPSELAAATAQAPSMIAPSGPAASGSAVPSGSTLAAKRMRQAAIAGAVLLLAIIAVTAQQLFHWMQNGNSGQAQRNRVPPDGSGGEPNAATAPAASAPPVQPQRGNAAAPVVPASPGVPGASGNAPPGGGGAGTSSSGGGGAAPPQVPPPAVPAPQGARRQQGARAVPPVAPVLQQPVPRALPAPPGPQLAQVPDAGRPAAPPGSLTPAPAPPSVQISPMTLPAQNLQPMAPEPVARSDNDPGHAMMEEVFPLRAHLGYGNIGLPVLGRDRWTAGLDAGGTTFDGALLSYQYTSDLPLWRSLSGARPAYEMHAASIVAPLPWRDRLKVFGFYAAGVPGFGPDIGNTATAWRLSGRYVLALPVTARFEQQIQAGFDFKRSNNNVLFGGLRVFDVTSQIEQFSADYSFLLRDALGQTSTSATVAASPGGLGSGNSNEVFDQQQPYAQARYAYARLDATRTLQLPQAAGWVKNLGWLGGTSSLTRVAGQWASTVLLPSEQLGIGGMDTVPGYNERAANGSTGILVDQELLTPAFGILRHFLAGDPGDLGDLARLSGFFAYGSVRNQKSPAGTPADHDLMSAGLGVHYSLREYVDFRFVYGWQLRGVSGLPAAAGPNDGQLGELTLTLSYP